MMFSIYLIRITFIMICEYNYVELQLASSDFTKNTGIVTLQSKPNENVTY